MINNFDNQINCRCQLAWDGEHEKENKEGGACCKRSVSCNQEVYKLIIKVNKQEWTNAITGRKENRRVEICSTFLQVSQLEQRQHIQLFNEKITRAMEQKEVVVASDASPKNSKMVEFQRITNLQELVSLQCDVCYKT